MRGRNYSLHSKLPGIPPILDGLSANTEVIQKRASGKSATERFRAVCRLLGSYRPEGGGQLRRPPCL